MAERALHGDTEGLERVRPKAHVWDSGALGHNTIVTLYGMAGECRIYVIV